MQHACHWLVKRKSPHCGRRTSHQAGLLSLELKLLLLAHQHSSTELWGVLRLLAEWNTSMLSAILWHWLDSQKKTFSILRHWLDPREKSLSKPLHWLVWIPKRIQYITASYNEQVAGGYESCPFSRKEPMEWLFHRAKFFLSVRTRKWNILSYVLVNKPTAFPWESSESFQLATRSSL